MIWWVRPCQWWWVGRSASELQAESDGDEVRGFPGRVDHVIGGVEGEADRRGDRRAQAEADQRAEDGVVEALGELGVGNLLFQGIRARSAGGEVRRAQLVNAEARPNVRFHHAPLHEVEL